jgi:hypothetical protein
MAKKKLSIDDLLNSLKNPNTPEKKGKLANTKETWTRIGEGDSFSELGLQSSELDDFLKEWIEENPYTNI